MELDDIQLLGQLVDNIEKMTQRLEKAFQDNDSETFQQSSEAMIDFKNKIAELLKNEH